MATVTKTASGGTITNINGGQVYSNPFDNPNYKPNPVPTTATPATAATTTGLPTGYVSPGAKADALVAGNRNFSVTPTETVPSTALAGGITRESLLKKNEDLLSRYRESALPTETETQLTEQLNQSKQLSRQAQQAFSREQERLQTSGALTQDVAQGFISETARRFQRTLGDLGTSQQGLVDQLNAEVAKRTSTLDGIKFQLQANKDTVGLIADLQKLTQPDILKTDTNEFTGDVTVIKRDPQTGEVKTEIVGNVGAQKKYVDQKIIQEKRPDGSEITVSYGTLPNGKIDKVILSTGGGVTTQNGAMIGDVQNNPTVQSITTNEGKNGAVLTNLLKSKSIGQTTRTQIANALGVLQATESLANTRQTEGFKGISPVNKFLDTNLPASGIFKTVREAFRSKEGSENAGYINAINLKVQQWASGASLTDSQTKQVEKFTPTVSDTDNQVRTKLNNLHNFMLEQASAQLQSEGIDFKPIKVNLFETYDLLQKASPEQVQALKAQGLIQ